MCLSGMIFFKWKKISKLANTTKDVKNKICPLVGNDIIRNGVSKNHQPKQDAFDEVTSKVFKIDECTLKGENKKKSNNDKCLEDYSQCVEYADVWQNPKLNNQSDNVNKNRFHREKRYNNTYKDGYYHTGTDILSNGKFLDLHSLLCGEVIDVVNTFKSQEYAENSLGNTITIKSKDKNGENIWIKYCHLDRVSVSVNEKVKHGQKIGVSGCTGNAGLKKNGSRGIKIEHWHVHIEASRENKFFGSKKRVDPELFMKTKFDNTKQGNPIK